ncbi:uncharacterized protein LOC118465716 [Anopheles albimanus]|uniref:Uncharacterized protein n=1 Tax=Anopheles albimanus TaxID=7167 RepID=A0A182FK40_ANOAL|nr:uncharacterized protein LOC118465716 [Anopheles albimanus]
MVRRLVTLAGWTSGLADVDFFLPAELLLLLPGFHLAARWHRKRWLRLLYRLTQLVQLFQYLLWADRFYLALVDGHLPQRSGKILHVANTFGVLTMMLARMLVLRWFLRDIEQFKGYQRHRRRTRQLISGHQHDSLPTIVTIAVAFQAIGLADRAVFCFSRPYRHELYEMPSNLAAHGWWCETVVQLLSFDFAWRWAAAYNASLTTINTLLMGLADDLAHLVAGYGRLLEDARRQPPSLATTNETVGHWQAVDWRQLEHNIAHTVGQHERFLAQLDRLKPFLRATFLVMFYSAVLFLALGTFMITANGTTTYGVILSGFLFALLLECYWCCRLVDRLNELNAGIGTLLYGLDWPTELRYTAENASEASHYRQARAALSIIQSRTQIGLGISCGGMFAISSEAFASLVKMTYTMLMFLRDTQSVPSPSTPLS